MRDKKQQFELDLKQQTGSKLGKEYVKARYCHPAYLTEMLLNAGLDEADAGIKIAEKNINNLRYADDTTLMAESKEELNSLFVKVKVGLNSTFRKLRSWHLVPALHGKEVGKQWQTLFLWAPKSLQRVTAAIKLKDTCFLEGKVWPLLFKTGSLQRGGRHRACVSKMVFFFKH